MCPLGLPSKTRETVKTRLGIYQTVKARLGTHKTFQNIGCAPDTEDINLGFEKERCPPRQKPRVEHLEAKVKFC